MEERDEADAALGRVPGRFYMSRRFSCQHCAEGDTDPHHHQRFAYQVFDEGGETVFASDRGWDWVVRETATRQQLRATLYEDSRQISMLSFQRFSKDGRSRNNERFNLAGPEIVELRAFLQLIDQVKISTDAVNGMRLSPEEISGILAQPEDVSLMYAQHKDTFAEVLSRDPEGLAMATYLRRRASLERFEKLLNEPEALTEALAEAKGEGRSLGEEQIWQEFFEANRWIFGLGLSLQFQASWDPARLEQTTVGSRIAHAGKRPDALLRSLGALSTLSLAEIKKPSSALLKSVQYRKGVWAAGEEVSGGVAQCQTTVDETVRESERLLRRVDVEGFSTGEETLVCRPRSVLVIGTLSQFKSSDGHLNVGMHESFERFRRSLRDPEIVTFDELYERARMLVDEEERDSGLRAPF